MIDIYRNELSLCRLETAKLWQNRRFEIAGHIRSGMTRIEAVDYYKNDLREQKDGCLFQGELLQLEVSELEKAKANLAKYTSER